MGIYLCLYPKLTSRLHLELILFDLSNLLYCIFCLMFEITPDKLLKLEYENETLKNDSILSDYERIQFIENGIGLSVTFIEHT
jgi:hypothetical protein